MQEISLTCGVCSKDSGTSLVCVECMPHLNDNQKQTFRRVWHKIVVESAGNRCEVCGHSAEFDSGELCGDHIQTVGSRPDLRFDLLNGTSKCGPCHHKRHTGELPVNPPPSPMKKKQPEKKKAPAKVLCKKCNRLLAVPSLGNLCVICYK